MMVMIIIILHLILSLSCLCIENQVIPPTNLFIYLLLIYIYIDMFSIYIEISICNAFLKLLLGTKKTSGVQTMICAWDGIG